MVVVRVRVRVRVGIGDGPVRRLYRTGTLRVRVSLRVSVGRDGVKVSTLSKSILVWY